MNSHQLLMDAQGVPYLDWASSNSKFLNMTLVAKHPQDHIEEAKPREIPLKVPGSIGL